MKCGKLICIALAAMSFLAPASAQKKYIVTSLKGESFLQIDGKWKPLTVNTTLRDSDVIRNYGQPVSEVGVREAGTMNCYNIHLLNDVFEFRRFLNAKPESDKRNGASSFSYFVGTQLKISRTPNVKITRTQLAAAHRDTEPSPKNNAIINSLTAKMGGVFHTDRLACVESDYSLELTVEDGWLMLYNDTDKILYANVFCLSRDEYGDFVVEFLHNEDENVIIEPFSVRIIEFCPLQDRTVLAIAMENPFDPLSLQSDLINANGSEAIGTEIIPTAVAVLK